MHNDLDTFELFTYIWSLISLFYTFLLFNYLLKTTLNLNFS